MLSTLRTKFTVWLQFSFILMWEQKVSVFENKRRPQTLVTDLGHDRADR
jgi:hypothetical protein